MNGRHWRDRNEYDDRSNDRGWDSRHPGSASDYRRTPGWDYDGGRGDRGRYGSQPGNEMGERWGQDDPYRDQSRHAREAREDRFGRGGDAGRSGPSGHGDRGQDRAGWPDLPFPLGGHAASRYPESAGYGGGYRPDERWDEYGAGRRNQSGAYDYRGAGPYRRADYADYGQTGHDRGMIDRASDEVASWFGDSQAQRRREEDHRGRGPKTYQRSDARIEEDVNDYLTDDSRVDASEITVSVTDREVTLDGTVTSREAKRRAEDCAERVSGVQHVQNNLRVRRPGDETSGLQTAGTTGGRTTG